VVRVHGHILLDLDLVDGLQYGQTVADTVEANLLEVGMLQHDQGVARDALVCRRRLACVCTLPQSNATYQ
jgi:hypothetical protein